MDKPVPLSFLTLLKTDWPEDVFIEGGILSRGDSILLGAESKAGKSTLLTNFTRELIEGGEFLGFKVLKPLKVLYMQAELREPRLKIRIMPKYSKVSEKLLESSFVWNTRGLILIEKDEAEISKHLKNTTPDVLLIDPLSNFHTNDENNATEMSKFFRVLDRLKFDFGLSIVLAHHFRKAQSTKTTESLMEKIRGSSVMRGWVDTTIVMESRTKTGYRRLEFDTRNSDQPIKRIIKYNEKTKEFDWHDPITEILEMLRDKMDGERLLTTQVISLIMKHCGHFVSTNRTKAFEMKDLLISTNMLLVENEGKSVYLKLAENSE